MLRQAIICFWLLVTFSASGQQVPEYSLRALRAQLEVAKADSVRLSLLIQMSFHYLEAHKPDSVAYCAQRARRLSAVLHSEKGYADATAYLCQALLFKEDLPGASAVLQNATGPLRVRLLILFGEHYLYKPGELSANLDQAGPYLRQAQALSAALGSYHWLNESHCALAKYSFARGNLLKGKQYFMSIISDCQRANDKVNEARWWTELGIYLPATPSTYADGIAAYERGLLLYRQLHDKKKEVETLEDLAIKHYKYGRLAAAEKLFLQALELKKALKISKTYVILYHLSSINRSVGRLNKALWYGVEAIKNMEARDDKIEAILLYSNLADVYRELGQTEKSVALYRLALQHPFGRDDFYFHAISASIAHGLLKLGNSTQALHFLKTFIRQHPPVRINDQEIMEAALGDCYSATGQYSKAEQHYLAMIKLDAQAQENKDKEIRTGYSITGSQAYSIMARFYADRSRFEQARYYAQHAVSFTQEELPLSRRRDLENIFFRVELAAGNNSAASKHFEQYEALKDSIFSAAKSRQIEELQIQYETAKKEQALALLRNQGQLQQQELRQSIQMRNFSYVGMGLLLLVLGLGYNRFRLKQQSNQQLEARQAEIDLKNTVLEHLLIEKEWLLKEIHHRVKNNLQVVMSLLNSQASYLSDDTAALAAIQESQHRVQAMALIHQRLYQSEQVARIAMPFYINELVTYLRDFYDLPQPIAVELEVAPIEIDITLAVPLGLIINEAITNALKYAFPGGRPGRIRLSLHRLSAVTCQLIIEDDGVGLPPDSSPKFSHSLGMTLIHGFSRQLGGELTLSTDHGLKIMLVFSEPHLHSAPVSTDYAYH
jgi:two-component sensor histidine kinase